MTSNKEPQEPHSGEQPVGHQGDHFEVGDIKNSKAVAIGRGATAVYHGLSVTEVAALVVELKGKDQPTVWVGRIPYLGLKAFQESDAEFFFGREELVDDLLGRVEENNFVVIAGPSGSGKSSVARAGLFHALRQGRVEGSDRWLLAAMHPKDDPIEQLALSMARLAGTPAAGDYIREQGMGNPLALHQQAETLLDDDARRRLVLFVDQFEEVFTEAKDDEAREAFIKLLTTAACEENGRTIILLSLRSDFISNCALYPELRAEINKKNQFQLVGAMEPRDLAKAITLPSLEVGAAIEPALVKQIIDDMKGEPGALPLMSFALRDLFLAEKSEPGETMDLTLREYIDRGGIDRALERHADQVFDEFSSEQKALARSIFARLITVGEGRVDTRRTVTFSELKPAGVDEEAVAAVVGALSAEGVRLVTTSGLDGDEELTAEQMAAAQTTVTIAHEKLIDAWPWLRQLVDENREIIALQNQIANDARDWAESEDVGFLYRGGRLLNVEEHLDEIRPNLDALSLRFIEASVAERERRDAELEANRQREEDLRSQKRVGRILRWATAIVVILLLVAIVLAFQSYSNANQAQEERADAVEARATSEFNEVLASAREEEVANLKNRIQASQLAAASGAELAIDQELALLLATAGLGMSPQPDTVARFYSAILSPYRNTLDGHKSVVNTAVFSPDGSTILTASNDGSARIWNTKGDELVSLTGHTKGILSAVFSLDGQQIVTASNDGSAKLWNTAGEELASLDGHGAAVRSASFSPDGSLIATASNDGSARLWNTAGEELASLEGHGNKIRSASFSPDGNTVLTISTNHSVKLWDLEGNELASLDGHTAFIWTAVFSPDGNTVLTASTDGTAKLWNLAGEELVSLEGHRDKVRSASFSPDGQQIVTASSDRSARIWDVEGSVLATFDGHRTAVLLAVFSPDGSSVLTASTDRSAKVWDITGEEIASLDGHTARLLAASFSPDGSTVVTASYDGSAKLWDVAGAELASLDGHTDEILMASISPDGGRILTASRDHSARIWDTAGEELASLDGHEGAVRSAVFSPDGSRIVTASGDGSARVWDAAGEELVSLDGHEGAVRSAVFSPDGSRIVTASADGSARVWDAAGEELASLDGHQDAVISAVFSPDGSRIVTASADGSARVWDAAGEELASLDGHQAPVLTAAFSPTGDTIVTASEDGSARIWNAMGELLATLNHTDVVRWVAFSPDGALIITASDDDTAKVWDIAGEQLATLEGHVDLVSSAQFSPDGRLIVTASGDDSARVWDISGVELAKLEGHKGSVSSAVFSPDGRTIVTSGQGGSAKIWAVYPGLGDKLAIIRQRLDDGFGDKECFRFFRDDLESCPRELDQLYALFEDDLESP